MSLGASNRTTKIIVAVVEAALLSSVVWVADAALEAVEASVEEASAEVWAVAEVPAQGFKPSSP